MDKAKEAKLFVLDEGLPSEVYVKAMTRKGAVKWLADRISSREIGAVEAMGIDAKDIQDATAKE